MKLTFLLSTLAILSAKAQEIMAVDEHKLYEDISQGARSYKFYSMTPTRDYYTEGSHLTFKVIADSFGSDPDIYISDANQYPTNSSTSGWYCEQKGSETCILKDGQFAIGRPLYFGIKCTAACHYKMKIWYSQVTDLTTANRRQLRFEAYSTQILKYTIPNDISGRIVNSMEVKIEPESQYSPMEMVLTFDADFQIIEGRPSSHISDSAIALKFGSNDQKWTGNQIVYAILDVAREDRYYITTIPRTENDNLKATAPSTIFVNPFQQDCYKYFVERVQTDVRIDIQGYQGHADVYIAPWKVPNGPSSTSVVLRAAHGDNRAVVLSASDRKAWDTATGNYMVCFYAYTDFSAKITVQETELSQRYDQTEGQILTQMLPANSWFYSRYQNSAMNRVGKIFAYMGRQLQVGATDEVRLAALPNMYYKICAQTNYVDCEMDVLQGWSTVDMTQLVPNNAADGGSWDSIIAHDPSVCPDSNNCTYLFAVQNPYAWDLYLSTLVSGSFEDPGNILLTKTYANAINQGQYFNYELSPVTNSEIMPYLSSLKIKLFSMRGDADLFASLSDANPTIDNAAYMSRTGLDYDQIVIVPIEGQDVFNKPIYFSVFAGTYTQYEVRFEYTFMPEYNALLEAARPLGEAVFVSEVLADEYQERLYSYKPWWSGQENRTSIFLADMIANKVFFYASWNTYPKHFATSLHDWKDTISIYGDAPAHHNNGTYYIRLRPDFSLADLLSERQYVYNMYAFSMAPVSKEDNAVPLGYDTLELGQEMVGFVNATYYQDYRYFLMNIAASYTITLTRLPGRGKPIFFVKPIDSESGVASRASSVVFQSVPLEDADGNKFETTQVLTITPADRDGRVPRCGTILHSLQSDGTHACFLAISVTCGDTDQCAYTLKIEQDGFDSSRTYTDISAGQSNFVPPPPGPIIHQDYTNGQIASKGGIKYYWFPIDVEKMNEGMVLLNKTQMSGQAQNGDSYLLVNIVPNVLDSSAGYNYNTWRYPAVTQYQVKSQTRDSQAPEIVEICNSGLKAACETASGCAMLVGVVGDSTDYKSDYRLRGFYGDNKLEVHEPRKVVASAGQPMWQYYWFVITDTVANANAKFDYVVSVGTENGGNPDLYVSLMDGRHPTDMDYDLASQKMGADSIRIASDSKIFQERGWSTRNGVVVVLGVRVKEPTTFTVVRSRSVYAGEPLALMQRLEVGKSVEVELTALNDLSQPRGYSQMFNLFNWGNRNLTLTLTMKKSNGTISYGQFGQLDTNQNIYTAIPINATNAVETRNVSVNEFQTLLIDSNKCHACWYFVNVSFDQPEATTYKLTASQTLDAGGQFNLINTRDTDQVLIKGNLDAKRKFILDSMDNWSLTATVSTGDVTVYIGMDPRKLEALANGDNPDNYIWKTQVSDANSGTINVKQTDANFILGSYYFIYMKSSSNANSIVQLTLKQERSVNFLGNDKDFTYQLTHPWFNFWSIAQKFTYRTVKEQIKFHVFQVPKGLSNAPVWHKVKLSFTSLTPQLYPIILLKKVGYAEDRTSELPGLTYPSLVDYELQFGVNPFDKLGSSTFEYEFYGSASAEFTYYTMAVYQNNWGLTSQLKSEYQLRVSTDIVSQAEVDASGWQVQSSAASEGLVGRNNIVSMVVRDENPGEDQEVDENRYNGWFHSSLLQADPSVPVAEIIQ